jgi:membrane associated rhomboid family serine protease
MLPLRDDIPSSTRPTVTYLLIAANVLAFLWELSGADVLPWTLVPARFTADPASNAVTVLTAMFLHGGWLHLLGNMLYLWIFGDNVEDRLGHGRFVLLYVAGGAAAALAQVAIAPDSGIPMLGASGAIASVLGAYIVLYPRASVYTWVPIFLGIVRIPALVWLGLWFALQLLSGVASLGAQPSGGVAFFAHAGGFVAGVVLVKLLDRGPRWRPGARPLTTFP